MQMYAIPLEAHLLTLTVTTYREREFEVAQGSEKYTQKDRVPHVEEVPPDRDETGVKYDVESASAIWADAGIVFALRRISHDRMEAPHRDAPPGQAVDQASLDKAGIFQ